MKFCAFEVLRTKKTILSITANLFRLVRRARLERNRRENIAARDPGSEKQPSNKRHYNAKLQTAKQTLATSKKFIEFT